MAVSPFVTLTANLQSIIGDSELSGAAILITLCGYGQTIPVVPGQGVLADAGVPQIIAQSGSTPISVELFSNAQITPANTYYEIAVIDENENVIQSGIYPFTATGAVTIDLSNAAQVVQPVLTPPIAGLTGFKYTFAGSGNSFSLPSTPTGGIVVQLWYNGGFQGFNDGTFYGVAGTTVTLNFTANEGDVVYVLYYAS
jgi:hypothetical protein